MAWELGDALWNYHGGRPGLGALLVPAIKEGELGWKTALLRRLETASLPAWAGEADLICPAPTAFHRRMVRGFDLAEEATRIVARRTGRPCSRVLRKRWLAGQQAERIESERRRLPQKAVFLASHTPVAGKRILLLDDVWTTGTTLLRCAQALRQGGAALVHVLALFRAT